MLKKEEQSSRIVPAVLTKQNIATKALWKTKVLPFWRSMSFQPNYL